MNHHQLPCANHFYQTLLDDYRFIATSPLQNERTKVGYRDMNRESDFIIRPYESDDAKLQAISFLSQSDVVITGSAPEYYLDSVRKQKTLLFRYAERPMRHGLELHKYPVRFVKWRKVNPKSCPIYLLCSSAYTAYDYSRMFMFRDRTYKWGYFPETVIYDSPQEVLDRKIPNKILWVGRFLELKHPDDAIYAFKRLTDAGYDITMDMIGVGPTEDSMRALIARYGLTDRIRLLGGMSPEDVRSKMEEASIFLFNSDRREGWGAVLNESMNSGCAVVASHAIGAVPFLMKDRENGLIYRSGDRDMLFDRIKYLLDNPEQKRRMGIAAYHTIADTWNAKVATERFLQLAQAILDGNPHPDLFAEGPCSRAGILKDNWYKG